jgi:hypothetical protein
MDLAKVVGGIMLLLLIYIVLVMAGVVPADVKL